MQTIYYTNACLFLLEKVHVALFKDRDRENLSY